MKHPKEKEHLAAANLHLHHPVIMAGISQNYIYKSIKYEGFNDNIYPLVNVYIAIENGHV